MALNARQVFPKTRFKWDSKDFTLSEVSSCRNKEVKLEVGIGFRGDSSVAIYGVCACVCALPASYIHKKMLVTFVFKKKCHFNS